MELGFIPVWKTGSLCGDAVHNLCVLIYSMLFMTNKPLNNQWEFTFSHIIVFVCSISMHFYN